MNIFTCLLCNLFLFVVFVINKVVNNDANMDRVKVLDALEACIQAYQEAGQDHYMLLGIFLT